jgi:hypothetical protein
MTVNFTHFIVNLQITAIILEYTRKFLGFKELDTGSSTVVKHLTHNHKIEGSNPIIRIGRVKMIKRFQSKC